MSLRHLVAGALLALPCTAAAQTPDHMAGMDHAAMTGSADAVPAAPTQAGQSAFAALSEITAILLADSTTNWSRVNLEALRHHLADMDAVTLHSSVRQADVPGGARMDVTGTGATAGAIRRMLADHTAMLDGMPDYVATVTEIPGGVRLVVRAEHSGDARTTAQIRGLGFIGLLTVGAHHQAHHLALARGEPMMHH